MKINNRILIVDDSADNRMILDEILRNDYTLLCVDCGSEALRIAPEFRPNLILLDVMMPGFDGYDTCSKLRLMPGFESTKIVMVSARGQVQDRLLAYRAGAVDFITKPFHEQEIRMKVHAWMQMVHQQEVNELWAEIDRTQQAVGSALVSLAAFRDTETGDHLFRMRWYALALAEQLATTGPYIHLINEEFLRHLYWSSPLHDIGKVAIDDSILRKPSRLTSAEFAAVKEHAAIGGDILAAASEKLPHSEYLVMAAQIARYHHERFDGTGYPEGLGGLRIPLEARIVAVADVFDALTSDRVYRKALAPMDAAEIIIAGSGTQFDPAVVQAFRLRFADFREARSNFSEGLQLRYDTELIAAQVSDASLSNADHVEHLAI